MSSHFESMVNEMVRWNTTREVGARTPTVEAPEPMLEDEDELDSNDENSAWPSSGHSDSAAQTKGRNRAT